MDTQTESRGSFKLSGEADLQLILVRLLSQQSAEAKINNRERSNFKSRPKSAQYCQKAFHFGGTITAELLKVEYVL